MKYVGELPEHGNGFMELTGLDWIEITKDVSLAVLLCGLAIMVCLGILDALLEESKKGLPERVGTFLAFLYASFCILGLVGFLLGLGLDGSGHAVRIYVVNGTSVEKKVSLKGQTHTLPAETWTLLRHRDFEDPCTVVATLASGEKLDSPCLEGLSILNLSNDKQVAWQQPLYKTELGLPVKASSVIHNTGKGHGAGYWSVTKLPDKAVDVFHFTARPPKSRSVKKDSTPDPVVNLFFVKP